MLNPFARKRTHEGHTRPEVNAMLDAELERHREVLQRLMDYVGEGSEEHDGERHTGTN